MNTYQRLIEYFKKNHKIDVSLNTSINNDLEFSGMDVTFLFERLEKEFNIPFTEMPYGKFFHDEVVYLFLFYKLFQPQKLYKPPLTIGHLVKVIERGYWFEPEE